MSFLSELITNPVVLSSVEAQKINDRSNVNLAEQLYDELEDEEKQRHAFFQSGCNAWFSYIEPYTFSSSFCSLLREEAKVIVAHWHDLNRLRMQYNMGNTSLSSLDQEEEKLYQYAVSQLLNLKSRLQNIINDEAALSPVRKVFVKLTTRSPKDSKKALQRAARASEARFHSDHVEDPDIPMSTNHRWRILCEEVMNACAVSNAEEALELLLDSERVVEDIEFASRKNEIGRNCHELDKRLGLVARSWDPRLRPESEFRGICQDGKLTCLCQYYHPLLFPEILQKKEVIAADIMGIMNKPEVMEAIRAVGGNCIIDFAWLETGKVMIIELNPFDGIALGIFPASTGLFLWDNPTDKEVMSGRAPFEFRCREELLPKHALLSQCSKEWLQIIYPTPKSASK